MSKYTKLISHYEKTTDGALFLEKSVNSIYGELVKDLLEYVGCNLDGTVALHQDCNLPYLWHIHEETSEESIPLDFIFNAKTEQIVNKYEEVC